MARAFRQPLPSWRRQQLDRQHVEREAAFQGDVVGPTMGLDQQASAPVQPANQAGILDNELGGDDVNGLPIAQVEHHTIGKDFILAGRAVFTVAGRDKRFTFRVNAKPPQEGSRYTEPSYFVSVLTGGGERPYAYVGILDTRNGQVKFTKGSTIKPTAPAAIALQWTLARVWAGQALPAPAAIYHEGRCGRCGRPLTVPESILTGFGPECARRMEQ